MKGTPAVRKPGCLSLTLMVIGEDRTTPEALQDDQGSPLLRQSGREGNF